MSSASLISFPGRYSKAGLALTERFEQFRSQAYADPGGVLTIGYGHTGPEVVKGLSCTYAQAIAWLYADTQTAQDCVNNYVTCPVTQGEYDALVDFAFNVGCGAFIHSTCLAALNGGDLDTAAEQFDNWKYDHGKPLAGLLRRRQAETAEFDGTQPCVN